MFCFEKPCFDALSNPYPYCAILSKCNCSPTSSSETPTLMERFPLPLSHSLLSQTNFLFPLNKNQASTPIFLFWVPLTLPQNLAFPFQQSPNLIFYCTSKQKGTHFTILFFYVKTKGSTFYYDSATSNGFVSLGLINLKGKKWYVAENGSPLISFFAHFIFGFCFAVVDAGLKLLSSFMELRCRFLFRSMFTRNIM